MRFKWLLCYWLAVAAVGVACLFIPVFGWIFGVGAFGYLFTTAGLSAMLTGTLFEHFRKQSTTFGIDNRRFTELVAGCALVAVACGLLSGQYWLATGGAGFIYLAGEWVIVDRMYKAHARRAAPYPTST